MKKVYKKIITINHNDKLFTIFLADDNRLTFLETNEEGKYFYPLLDDFIELNDIYNNHNPLICDITKYAFKEKVKRTALGSLLSLVIITTGVCTFNPYTVKALNDEVILSQDDKDKKELIEITNKEKLDEILGYKAVSIEEVHKAIEENNYIPFLYKIKTHLFLDVFMNDHPDWDLRIFYENIKTTDFNIVDDDYFINLGKPGVGARYNAILNQLLLPKNSDDETFYHELSHLFDVYYREYDDKIIIKMPIITTLNETMTNNLSDCITTSHSYGQEETVFNYFRNYVYFNFYDYNQEGNSFYVNLLKERYPNVDIDFIFFAMDTVDKIEKNLVIIFI